MNEPMIVAPKPWYTSKTIWFNAIVVVLSVALYLLEGLSNGKVELPFYVSPEVVATAIGVINFVLRMVTVQPVKK